MRVALDRQGIVRPRSRFGPEAGAVGRNHPAIDVILVATVLLAALFNKQIGPISPMVLIGAIPAFVWLRYERLPAIFARAWPLLLLPAFVLFSSAWSIDPAATLRYGTLYSIAVLLAMLLGAGTERGALLIGIFIAFAIYNGSAVTGGSYVAWGGGRVGKEAFSGLAASKNAAGDIAALGILASLAGIALGVRNRSLLLAAAGGGLVTICLWILWNSHATGALIAGGTAAICLTLWLVSQQLPLQARAAIFVVVALAVVVAVSTQSIWLQPLFDFVLSSAGKDAGLTGRIDLWRKADQLISERPLLGLGYGAFWVHGNLDAEAIWRQFGILGRGGFNFHNGLREILVHLGYVGLGLFLTVWACAILMLFSRAMVRPHPTRIFFCGWAVYSIMKINFEVVGFGSFHYGVLLAYIAFAFAFRLDREAAPRTAAAVTIRR